MWVGFVRERMTDRRGGGVGHVPLNDEIIGGATDEEARIVRIHTALEELADVDPRMVRVVEMRYFAGMREIEIAAVLNVTERTVRRDWEKARLLLRSSLQ